MTVGQYAAAAQQRAWRAYADARTRLGKRGSATHGLESFGRPCRTDLLAWNDQLSEGHAAYRRDHAPTATTALVICVSRRPWLVDDVVANVVRQVDVGVEFVLVTNDADFGDIDLDEMLGPIPRARHIATDPAMSLGQCLNLGLDATRERFVAKFDDDDYYGSHYLADSLRAHGYSGAGVVGKHTYYAEFTESGDRYLRFPGHEFSYSSTLAGGTLVIDRDRVGDLHFPDISLGEDRAFIASCHRRGVSTFAADRFNFVQRRGADNTWSVAANEFLVETQRVEREDDAHVVDR